MNSQFASGNIQKKKTQTFKLFYKWRSTCKVKQLNGLQEQLAEKNHERNLLSKVLKSWKKAANWKEKSKSNMNNQECIAQNRAKASGTILLPGKPNAIKPTTMNRTSTATDDNDVQQRDVDQVVAYQTEVNIKTEVCESVPEHEFLNDKHVFNNPVNISIDFDRNDKMIIDHATVTTSTDSHSINTHVNDMSTLSASGADTDNQIVNEHMMVSDHTIALQSRRYSDIASPKRLDVGNIKNSSKGRKLMNTTTSPQFTDQRSQKPHVESSTSGRLWCSECQKQFNKKFNLFSHQVYLHNKSSDYQCTKCDRYLPSPSKLKEHMIVHEGIRNFQCETCQKRFFRKDHLMSHMRSHTGEHKKLNDSTITTQDRRHSERVSQKRLAVSKIKNSSQERKRLTAATRPQFTVQSSQTPQIKRSTSSSFWCGKCRKQFKRKSELFTHQVYLHNKSSDYQCTKCDKYLPSASKLKDHMIFHEGIRNFQCKTCQKRFFRKEHLIGHMTSHTGEKPFICETCGKRFSQLSGLKCHIKADICMKS